MARPKFALGSKTPHILAIDALVGAALTAFATDTAFAQIVAPFRCKVVAVGVVVASKGGTHSTSTLDLKVGSSSILGAAVDIAAATAATEVEKVGSALSATAAEIAAGTAILLSTAESGGSSPTWKGVRVQLEVVPLGD